MPATAGKHDKIEANPKYAKHMMRMRSKTVEPVLGTLINFTNMRRINTRGIKQANKHILMAALVYNLKKFMHYVSAKRKTGASQMPALQVKQAKMGLFSSFWLYSPIGLVLQRKFCDGQN